MEWGLIVSTIGGVLQIAGVMLIFLQIGAAEKLFGVPPWLDRLGGWMQRPVRNLFGRLRQRRISSLSTNVVLGTAHLTATGELRAVLTTASGTVQTRLDALQKEIEDLRTEVDEHWRSGADDRAILERRLTQVETDLKATVAELRELIAALTIGSRDMQVVGAVLIVVGTFLVTIGPFLDRWLQ
jgi:hypothetical protein